MKEAVFFKGIPIQSNTYYRADQDKYDIYLSDTTRSYEGEYRSHTTNAGEFIDIGFLLKDLENVVLDFGGATLLFHGRIQPFLLDNCKNVTIRNVKLDYDRPFYTQGTILSCSETELRLHMDEGFFYRVDPAHKALIAVSETWEYRMNKNDCLLWPYDLQDRENHSILLALFGDEIYPKDNPPMPITQLWAEEDGADLILRGHFPADWIGRTDHKLVITHEPRDKCSLHMIGCEDIAIDHVQIVSGAAYGIMGMHTKNITIDHLDYIGNDLGNGRIVTNNADGIHCYNCYGKIEIKNCIMEGMLDDTVNVHNNFIAVESVIEDCILCRPKFAGKSSAFRPFLPGDRGAVYRGATREKKAEFTITAFRDDAKSGGRILKIAQTDLLPLFASGDIIENVSANPEVLIENCTFKRFRGTMRLQTAGKSVIRNCRFENREVSLMVTGDTAYWFEGGPVKDLTIENCYFAHGDLGYRICNDTQIQYTEKAPYYHSGITVKNCFFDGRYACKFDHVDGITITDNDTSATELLVKLDACGSRILEGVKQVR